jgi:hypothetical protein
MGPDVVIGMLPHAKPATPLQYHRRRGNECAHHDFFLPTSTPAASPEDKDVCRICVQSAFVQIIYWVEGSSYP